MKRNPLSIAFGNTLRELRTEHSISVSEISEAIGINSSYYRVLESGATTIHISKAIEIHDGLISSSINVDYEGIRDVLLGISYLNNLYVKKENEYVIDQSYKNELLEQLKVYEHKLGLLLESLYETEILKNLSKTNEEIIKILEHKQFTYLIKNFITDYQNFGESVEEIENNFVNNFFDGVPTYYFEYLNTIKNQLLEMPITINLRDMHAWEIRNSKKFKNLLVIIKDYNHIVAFKNLKKYQYPYLWNNKFESVHFIYLNDDNKDPKKIFRKHLLKSMKIEDAKELEEFDKTMSKVHFIKPSDEYRKKGLNILGQYNACWFFTFIKNNIKVGFTATIDDTQEEIEYTEGFSLKYDKATKKKLKYINSLIRKI